MSGVREYQQVTDGKVVEAIQFDGENRSVIEQWLGSFGIPSPPIDKWEWVVRSEQEVFVGSDMSFRERYQAQ